MEDQEKHMFRTDPAETAVELENSEEETGVDFALVESGS